jgi:acetamidase/formamidase
MHRRASIVLVLVAFTVTATAQSPKRLASRPNTVVWGEFPIDRPPALEARSGDTVIIDTLSHQGATQDEDPVTFLGKLGVKRDEILQDVLDFWASRSSRPREGRAGHILTGPLYVSGAEPGDTLEVEILSLDLRVPYGLNSTGPESGVLGSGYVGTRPEDPVPTGGPRLIRTEDRAGRRVGVVTSSIAVPLNPFMGTMAVAPPSPTLKDPGVTVAGVQPSRPPGVYGGNLDFRELSAGSRLFLPVFHKGAQFYAGDPHAGQGGGEVDGTAIEQSLTGTFRFTVHKGMTLETPRAETATHYVVFGIDLDLNRAMRLAVQRAVTFMVTEKKLSEADAYVLASLACDFTVAEAVNLTQVVAGKIPKELFSAK